MDRPAEDLSPPEPRALGRPRDLALLLLAVGVEPPRARARDQQADRAGGELLRRVLDRIASLDPEPDSLDEALACVVDAFGTPTGPTRAACVHFRQEWDDTAAVPGYTAWLLAEALERSRPRPPGERRSRGTA